MAVWTRIEGHAQSADIEVGLRAEIADPLWLLGRQRQFGEFTGEDGGSPVGLEVQASWSRLTRFRPGPLLPGQDGSAEAVPIDPRATVLEALVERERGEGSDAPGRWWDERTRTGRRLESMLIAAGQDAAAEAARGAFPFRVDAPGDRGPVDRRYAAVLAGRVTDGLAAAADAAARGGPHPDLLAAGGDADIRDVVEEWLAWVAATSAVVVDGVTAGPARSSTWDPERLEYGFAVAAAPLPGTDAEIVLGATEYDGTGLDWYSLDVLDGATLGTPAVDVDAGVDDPSSDAGTVTRRLLPTLVRYPGMPSDRYWELEDGRVNLGAVGAGPTDLARMLAIEYAVVHGPDWFLVPLELPVGTAARVDVVVVRDTFGIDTTVGSALSQGADRAGRQFQPGLARTATVDGAAEVGGEPADIPLLVVLPSSLGAVRGEPLERIDLQRDEMANLAWGIERRQLGAAGRGRTRTDHAAAPLPDPADMLGAELVWRLATSVPRNWLPLAPVREGDDLGGRVRFRAADFVDAAEAEPRTFGQLLSELDVVAEEEITRAGVRIDLIDQVARAIDGSLVVWRGRERRAGRGEADSHLRWDATT